jgi:hypothetical protein
MYLVIQTLLRRPHLRRCRAAFTRDWFLSGSRDWAARELLERGLRVVLREG